MAVMNLAPAPAPGIARKRSVSRRSFLKVGAASFGAGLVSGCGDAVSARQAHTVRRPRSPRNIIWMVSDGMSVGVPTLAEPLSMRLRGHGTAWRELMQRPEAVNGFLLTDSASGLVTDSAAAASAWSCGERIPNGQLNTRADGSAATPLARLLQERGTRVGIVTTDDVTGATPAGFAAVAAERGMADFIAPQFIEHADVLLGGGTEHFRAVDRADGRDLHQEFRDHGYAVVTDRSDLLRQRTPYRLLGTFGTNTIPYAIDRRHEAARYEHLPSLAEMTTAALGVLTESPKGFFLMVEGARIDHAAHRNDAAAMLWEQLTFDDAVRIALAFAAERDDTLVVVTTDHGNANPGLNGMGGRYLDTNTSFNRLAAARGSFDAVQESVAGIAGDDAAALRDAIATVTGITLDDAEVEALRDPMLSKAKADDVSIHQRSWMTMLGQALGNHTGIGFTSGSHTGDLVLCTALGPGASRFAGVHHHTQAAAHLREMFGVAAPAASAAASA